MKAIGFVRFLNQAWISTLGVRPLTTNRTWLLPNKDGTLLVDTEAPVIPWPVESEYKVPGAGTWKAIPPEAKYAIGWIIGAGAGGCSGARRANNENGTGGGGGGGGCRTPFQFNLTKIAARLNCAITDLQYQETIGAGGSGGLPIATDSTDGAASSSGGTSFLRFRANPANGGTLSVNVVRAVGGAVGQGGRRGNSTQAPGGSAVSTGGTFFGQAGQAGRSSVGNSGQSHSGAASGGAGGSGTTSGPGGAALGAPGAAACYDQGGDLVGGTPIAVFPLAGNAASFDIPGLAGAGGASGGYAPGRVGQNGGDGYRGGGGGGGGASDNGFASGAGGRGGDGYLQLIFSPYPC